MAAQRVLSDAAYRAFFAREAERGAEIIVDNGLFDLGYALPAAGLVEAARAVSAREIILPDVMRDGAATLKASEKAAREIRDLSGDAFRLCAVLHAADDDEWLRTYDAFVSSDWVGAIALPASRRPDPERAAVPHPLGGHRLPGRSTAWSTIGSSTGCSVWAGPGTWS